MINETTDPDNTEDEIYYRIDWGDGTMSNWYNKYWYQSGLMNHSWKMPGTCNIKVKAKDIYGNESDWSEPLTANFTMSTLMKLLLIGGVVFIGATAFWLLLRR